MASQAVRTHENEHVAHNARKADSEGMTAHSTVTIHMAACRDCGRLYVSGGTTKTTYSTRESSPGTGAEGNKGHFIDITV